MNSVISDMYRPCSGIPVSNQSVSISFAEILIKFLLMNPIPSRFWLPKS